MLTLESFRFQLINFWTIDKKYSKMKYSCKIQFLILKFDMYIHDNKTLISFNFDFKHIYLTVKDAADYIYHFNGYKIIDSLLVQLFL